MNLSHALKMEGNFSKALNYVDRVLDTGETVKSPPKFFQCLSS